MRYEIGQEIWIGDFSPLAPISVICPDCGGSGRLRVIFHDDTQVSIACRNCSSGYDEPTGCVSVYRNLARARKATIRGVEIIDGKTEWKVDAYGSYRIVDDVDAFDTEAAALVWAKQKAAAYEQEQHDRIAHKEKDTWTWAWNASYHRKGIKKAQRQIDYHTAKLAAAVVKAKDRS